MRVGKARVESSLQDSGSFSKKHPCQPKLFSISSRYHILLPSYKTYSEKLSLSFPALLKLGSLLPCSLNKGLIHWRWLEKLVDFFFIFPSLESLVKRRACGLLFLCEPGDLCWENFPLKSNVLTQVT